MKPINASFRDPSGYLFKHGTEIRRLIQESYFPDYDHLMESGLYAALTERKWLIPHEELEPADATANGRVIRPAQLRYVSYPYEWCFSQLKDAAILTLEIQQLAMQYGMTLKDASAFNIQSYEGQVCLIDTLSFERYKDGSPWQAYRQFCQHFLAPLALITFRDYRLSRLFNTYIDGIPLDLTSKMLPLKSWLNYGILAHIHLHAISQTRHADDAATSGAPDPVNMSQLQFEGLISSLLNTTRKLAWNPPRTEWGDYYEDTNYIDEAMSQKETMVADLIRQSPAGDHSAADFGANTGRFSRIAAAQGYNVLSFDIDEVAVEKNYRQTQHANETRLYPLMLDLTNPTPGVGWSNRERDSVLDRTSVSLGLALALIHHIAISNNVPLSRCAELFRGLCENLIIEFVPKSDSQVERLLATREDIFPDYTKDGFEEAFTAHFDIVKVMPIPGSERYLYLMSRR